MQKKQHCDNVHVSLVGKNCFQNNLLVFALRNSHECQCTFITVTCLTEIAWEPCADVDRKKLVCLDCYGIGCDELQPLLASAYKKVAPDCLLTLFNLAENTGIEETALGYGVRGFFYSNDGPDVFCRGTRSILKGEVWLSRKMLSNVALKGRSHVITQQTQNEQNSESLTPREIVVLTLLSSGASNKTIAGELFISIHTVRTHVFNIYKKLNVKNRTQATLWAAKNL